MARAITIALAGNPNTGKTTVFNNLTGAHQHVGNWPGVTVEKKEGTCNYKGYMIKIVDLPGVYSLTAYSIDEVIARNFVVEEKPDIVVDIVDASNLERNLYLATQLAQTGVPLIIALNMMDQADSLGYRIDVPLLSQLFGVPVVPMIANRNRGTEELLREIINMTENKGKAGKFKMNYGREIEEEIAKLEKLISQDQTLPQKYSPRWFAVKLLENDEKIIEKLGGEGISGERKALSRKILQAKEKSLAHLRNIYREETETIIADAQYGFISSLLKETLKKPLLEKRTISDRIDQVVVNRIVGIPLFLLIMWGVFEFTFTLSGPLMDGIDAGFGLLAGLAADISPTWLGSLVADGIISGVGSVLVFVPPIFLLFSALSILEDCGYLARAAFVMDRLMHRIGLHGRSFIPMLLGFGCNVPAIMATRTIDNLKDRFVTILINPLMSCGARLPIYVLLAGAFFPAHQGTVVWSFYVIGIVLAVLMAFIFRKLLLRGPSGHFVLELPPYRLPTVKGVTIHMWERGRLFLRRAGTIIFGVVVLIWLLGSMPWGVEYGTDESWIGFIGSTIAPVFAPLGFGQWQAAASLIFGFLAKEVVVGSMGVMFAVEEEVLGATIASQLGWTPLVAYGFMAFCLIFVPCVATIATIRRETNSWKWPVFTVLYTVLLAYFVALVIYQVGHLLGLG